MLCRVRGLSHGSFILTEGDSKSKEERRAGQKLRTSTHRLWEKEPRRKQRRSRRGTRELSIIEEKVSAWRTW